MVLCETRGEWWRPVNVLMMVVAALGSGGGAEAAQILGIFPTPSISHQVPFQAVMKALAALGHQFTVLSTDLLKRIVRQSLCGGSRSRTMVLRWTDGEWRRRVTVLAMVVAAFGGDGGADAARILGIFPSPSISHQLPFQAVMKALAARGHEITVLSPNPLKEPVVNYTDIDFSFSYPTLRKSAVFSTMSDSSGMTLMKIFARISHIVIDEQLNSPQFKEFLKSNGNNKFDLVFLEWISYQAYYGLIHHVGSPPLIGILSLGGLTNAYNAIGNPNNPAVNPELLHKYSDRMSFWQRIYNTYVHLWMTYYWETDIMPTQEALMRKYFGETPPPVAETEKNMSLLIINNHWSTDYPRALLPNVVQLTGIHVKENPGSLPKDLQEWLDGAEHGVVYMSLGTNIMSKDLPLPTREAILRAFARLPQRVLWKWEEDELPGRPANVRVGKWLPQQAVLKHPRLRLFVTQGGLQSFQEAVFHAVPLLVIPFMGDQHYNAEKIVSSGIGRRLELLDLTEENFYEEIMTLLQEKSYKMRIDEMSMVFREHKAYSLDTALWWIEYVLRHNGAPHLRSGAMHLAWYQYLLLDVVAAALVALLGFFFGLRFILRSLWRALRGGKREKKNAVNIVRKNQ